MSTTKTRPVVDLDVWCWQLQSLEDVAVFVRRHGPKSASPLPALAWTVGTTRQAVAELPSHAHADPVAVLKEFAAVLGSEVTVRHLHDRLVYAVRGRIGVKEGGTPRTRVAVRAVVFHPFEDEEND
jgi:hypothetical protein